MKFLLPIILLALPAFAAPPHNWPADFTATVTLSGVIEREHFTWQTANWRNDPGVWDLVLIPPDRLSAFVLIEFNGDVNVALRLDDSGQQFVVDDPANNIRDANPSFGVPGPSALWMLAGLTLVRRRKMR